MALLSRRKAGRVVVESMGSMEKWLEIKPVLEKFARTTGLDVHVSNPHCHSYTHQVEKGKVFIRFWSAPTKTRDTRIRSAYGINLTSGQRDAVDPSPMASVSFSDPDGTVVAQALGSTLYVLFDLPDGGGQNAGGLMRLILNQYKREFLSLSPEKKAVLMAEAEEKLREYELLALEKAFKRGAQDQVELLQMRVDSDHRGFQASVKEARTHWLVLQNARNALEDARKLLSASSEEVKTVLEELRAIAIANDSSLRISEDEIRLGVGQIDVEQDGVVYDIGRFEIAIYPNESGRRVVRCFNLTRTVDPGSDYKKFYHPHIHTDGEPCLGNIAWEITKMIEARQFVPVIYAMMIYLKSVNPDEAGWHLTKSHWPTKERKNE